MEDKLLSNYINHLNKVQRSDIRFQDVSHLLIFMRLIIEKESLKNDYPNISFFSDWYLHTKIDRNRFAKERIDSICQLMQSKFSLDGEILKLDNDDDFYIKISEIMGINKFKKEILNLFDRLSISSNFSNEVYITNFLRLYLTGICDRPLIFQNDRTEIAQNILIKAFQFIEIENKIYFQIITNLNSKLFVFKFFNKINPNEK